MKRIIIFTAVISMLSSFSYAETPTRLEVAAKASAVAGYTGLAVVMCPATIAAKVVRRVAVGAAEGFPLAPLVTEFFMWLSMDQESKAEKKYYEQEIYTRPSIENNYSATYNDDTIFKRQILGGVATNVGEAFFDLIDYIDGGKIQDREAKNIEDADGFLDKSRATTFIYSRYLHRFQESSLDINSNTICSQIRRTLGDRIDETVELFVLRK